jgi:hypothetical protein
MMATSSIHSTLVVVMDYYSKGQQQQQQQQQSGYSRTAAVRSTGTVAEEAAKPWNKKGAYTENASHRTY